MGLRLTRCSTDLHYGLPGFNHSTLKETAGASTSAPLPTMTVVVNWIEELKSRMPAK